MNFAQPLSEATLVSAAVKVVLPWSMWPMVPTFTCGLDRSNFSLAISQEPRALVLSSSDRFLSLQHRRHERPVQHLTFKFPSSRQSPFGGHPSSGLPSV